MAMTAPASGGLLPLPTGWHAEQPHHHYANHYLRDVAKLNGQETSLVFCVALLLELGLSAFNARKETGGKSVSRRDEFSLDGVYISVWALVVSLVRFSVTVASFA